MLHTNKKSDQMKSFCEALGRRDPELGSLVEKLLTRGRGLNFEPKSVFEAAEPKDFDLFLDHEPALVQNQQTPDWPLVDSPLPYSHYMPIRAFRGDPTRLWGPVDKLRIFLSSGTTSSPEGRSRSAYSSRGLLFYQAASLAGFFSLLATLDPPFSDDFLNMRAISLIPPVEKWPDSSLAQMMHWIAESWMTVYGDSLDPIDIEQKITQASDDGKPIFIFGTAFHFVNLLDKGAKFKLPKGSIVIETGGTKGRSRSIERDELYDLIARGFEIPMSSIVSEYGMCELASQAWDFITVDSKINRLEERVFKFPWWVRCGVMSSPTKITREATGALVIADPLRLDIGQRAIQTEDLATLNLDGTFRLQGRVPNAPLKGCSINVEDVADIRETSSPLGVTKSNAHGPILPFDVLNLEQRAPRARRWFLDLCSDREALNRLSVELRSQHLAREAIVDLMSGLPFDASGFAAAAANATQKKSIAAEWLFIAPSSHSLAMIQPIAAAMTIGLKVRIRIPNIAGVAADKTFLARAVELASEAGYSLQIVDASWRLGSNDLHDGEHVLVFGDDETSKIIKTFAPHRVSAFGNAVSLSLVQGADLENPELLRRVVRDQLSLDQRGCLSSRAILVIGGQPSRIHNALSSVIPDEIKTRVLDIGEQTAHALEVVRLAQQGFVTSEASTQGHVTMATKASSLDRLTQDVASGLGPLNMVMLAFVLPENTEELAVIGKLPKNIPVRAISMTDQGLKSLTQNKKSPVFLKNINLRNLGSLGAPSFDGLHLGVPFFASHA